MFFIVLMLSIYLTSLPRYEDPIVLEELVVGNSFYQNESPSLHLVYEEISHLSRLRHDNLVRIYQFSADAASFPYQLSIYSEYCPDGTLYQFLQKSNLPLPLNQTRSYMAMLLQAVAFLHQNGILHRCINSETIYFQVSCTRDVAFIQLSVTNNVKSMIT